MKLTAPDRVILFCAATGIDHAAVGIPVRDMQSMAVRGFIAHGRESGAYALDEAAKIIVLADGTPLTVRRFHEGRFRDHHNRVRPMQS